MSETFVPEKIPALSVRQPWAELIILGIKNVEFRSKATTYRGPAYIYASKGMSEEEAEDAFWNLGMVDFMFKELPRGVILGKVEIHDCEQLDEGQWGWLVGGLELYDEPIDPPADVQPLPTFWYPFGKSE